MSSGKPSGLVAQICEISRGLHTAQTLPPAALRALDRHLAARDIRWSAETGSGASTLLFSHHSRQHLVFALDAGSGSVANVRNNPLLGSGVIHFIEGPTQLTLPRHKFENKLQAILLDGPHAYPFPQMEYHALYPHLEPGGLLVVDDIHIPTVNHLFQFLRQDVMFELQEVVHRTAFFQRTDAPTFDPHGDGWWRQGYNRSPLFRYVWRERLKARLPRWLVSKISKIKRMLRGQAPSQARVSIDRPCRGAEMGSAGLVEGTVGQHEPDLRLWVLVRRAGQDGWWPQGGGPVEVGAQGRWSVNAGYGEDRDMGHDFDVAAVVVGPATNRLWMDMVGNVGRHGMQPVRLPEPEYLHGMASRVVRRSAR